MSFNFNKIKALKPNPLLRHRLHSADRMWGYEAGIGTVAMPYTWSSVTAVNMDGRILLEWRKTNLKDDSLRVTW